jgi:hypothetical protein
MGCSLSKSNHMRSVVPDLAEDPTAHVDPTTFLAANKGAIGELGISESGLAMALADRKKTAEQESVFVLADFNSPCIPSLSPSCSVTSLDALFELNEECHDNVPASVCPFPSPNDMHMHAPVINIIKPFGLDTVVADVMATPTPTNSPNIAPHEHEHEQEHVLEHTTESTQFQRASSNVSDETNVSLWARFDDSHNKEEEEAANVHPTPTAAATVMPAFSREDLQKFHDALMSCVDSVPSDVFGSSLAFVCTELNSLSPRSNSSSTSRASSLSCEALVWGNECCSFVSKANLSPIEQLAIVDSSLSFVSHCILTEQDSDFACAS